MLKKKRKNKLCKLKRTTLYCWKTLRWI